MPAIGEEAAILELMAIQEIFDVEYDESDREAILPAVMEGQFTTDPEKETVTYKFSKPIHQVNGEEREYITFKAPTNSDIAHINKGFIIKTDRNGKTEMDMGDLAERTKRAVLRLSGIPLGIFDRISRKDVRVFSGLFNFFD